MRPRKNYDPGEIVTAVLGIMFVVGFFGASLLPFEIGKYFGWLFMPPVVLIVGFIVLAALSRLLR